MKLVSWRWTVADFLVCGCEAAEAHTADCGLGKAEAVVLAALAQDGFTPVAAIRAALGALVDAGLVRDTKACPDLWDIVCGLLDDLWEASLLEGSPTQPADAPTRRNGLDPDVDEIRASLDR